MNNEAFYPLGWVAPGECLEEGEPGYAPYAIRRDTLAAQLDRLRRGGVNVIIEAPHVNGRIIAPFAAPGVSNWYPFSYFDADGAPRRTGQPRPGAFVEAMRAVMDLAHGTPGEGHPIYTLVPLFSFVRPGHAGTPYGGDDRLDCPAYRAFIETERGMHAQTAPERAARIPTVACNVQPARPFWEWNLWYIVTSLREHPGLMGWYLWDEPEDRTFRHLFGLYGAGEPIPPYTGPASLPTPDLLRYTYDLVRAFEGEGRPSAYQRHPVVVDIAYPPVFFSPEHFTWAKPGDPYWSSGPFDRVPGGGYHVPADLLGLESSAFWVHTAARGEGPRHPWYWDPNLISRRADALHDAAAHYALWGALVVAAQAQLPDDGPYRAGGPFPCGSGYAGRTRLLNDRDLVWTFLTPQINGLRGSVFYSHSLLPLTGPGAEQRRRTYRLIRQFQDSGLDDALNAPRLPEQGVLRAITVRALTNYYRSDPDFVGSTSGYDPGASRFSARYDLTDPSSYRAATFGRSEAEAGYGHPVYAEQYRSEHPTHRLLRFALHHLDDTFYLFVSNAYDAKITTEITLPAPPHLLEEGIFNLDAGGTFAWNRASTRLRRASRARVVALDLEPYEARAFRVSVR